MPIADAPQCLVDLHLDDLVDAMAPGDVQRAVWYAPLADVDTVEYRQRVVRDLQLPAIRRAAEAFESAVAAAHDAILARQRSHYPVPAELNLLEAIRRYCVALATFSERLAAATPHSEALTGVSAYVQAHLEGAVFTALWRGCTDLLTALRGPAFELGIQAGTVWVDQDRGRAAWTEQIEAFFSRFDYPAEKATGSPPRTIRYLNHVESQAIDLVASLNPDAFAHLHEFALAQTSFLPAEFERLAEEMRFFLGFQKVAERLGGLGVRWCLPSLEREPTGPVAVEGMVDVALALRRRPEDPALVANDLALAGEDRVVFITGPNQGGKTTFARAVGQVAYLASLGLPVQGRAASLPLLNPILTHFPQPDDPENQRGGLADEMVRLHTVLDKGTSSALFVLNELFSATSADDAMELAGLVLPAFDSLGCRVLWVTFLEDLVSSVEAAVSLVGQVAADDPTRPTFQFRRQPRQPDPTRPRWPPGTDCPRRTSPGGSHEGPSSVRRPRRRRRRDARRRC